MQSTTSTAAAHTLLQELSTLNIQLSKLDREKFRLTGCKMRPSFQEALKKTRELMLKKETVKLCGNSEPTNAVDKNAMAYQAQLPNTLQLLHCTTIGYVSLDKIPKVKEAIETDDIVEMEMEIPHYGHSARIPGYFSTVQISKKSKWLPNDPLNRYLKP